MSQQLIISVSREYGSGGRNIARTLAERLGIPYYDKDILVRVGQEKGIPAAELKQYDERGYNPFIYRTVNGFNNSPQDAVLHMQFDLMREMAQNGESFVIVGRCSEEILKGAPGFVSIFVLGDHETKLQRVMNRNNISRSDAERRMARIDRERRQYHNRFSKSKWGDSRRYDICINSSKLGLGGTVDILEQYVRARVEDNELK